MASKLRYLQIDPAELLLDPRFVSLGAAERGAYVSLLMLAEANGRIPEDVTALAGSTGCRTQKQFERHWQRLSGFFRRRKAMQSRYLSYNSVIPAPNKGNEKESEAKGSEGKKRDLSISDGFLAGGHSARLASRVLELAAALCETLEARSRSDRSAIRNVARWLVANLGTEAAGFAGLVDEFVILEKPPFFRAVAEAYENWYDVSDDEVIGVLQKTRRHDP